MLKIMKINAPVIIFTSLMTTSLASYPSSVAAVTPEIADDVEDVNESGKQPGFYTDSFHILPEAQVTTYYDDNVFASADTEDADTVAVISPTLKIRSLWEQHSLNLDTGGKIGRFQDNDAENYEDTWIDVDGKYELGKETSLFAGLGYSTKHEGRDSKESAQTLEEVTTYDVSKMELGLRHSRNDFTYRLGATYEALDFDNVGTLINDGRDRSVTGLGLRASKKISGRSRVFLQGLINQRSYDQALDSNGFNRDSDGYSTVLGISRALSGGGKVEAYAGVLSQDYDDRGFDSVNEADYGANLHWYPSQTVKLIGSLKRSLKETTEPGASGFLYTALNLQLDKKIITDVIGYASYSYGLAEYQMIGREDDYNGYSLGLKYFMSPHIFLTTSINHLSNDSNDRSLTLEPGESYDFDKNLFLLSLKVRLAP